MKKYLLLVLISNLLFSQNNEFEVIPLSKIKHYAKALTINFSNSYFILENKKPNIDFSKIDSLINSDIFVVDTLSSKGFDDYKIIKVSFDEYDFFAELGDIYNVNPSNVNRYYNDFILIYDIYNYRFYRVKGFIQNDFNFLFKELMRFKTKKEIRKLKKTKNFIKEYTIEGVDLKCYMKNRKNLQNWNIPCLRPSPSRISFDDYGNYFLE